MLLDILITVLIVITTVVIHASGMMIAVKILRKRKSSRWRFQRAKSVQLVGIVLMMFFVSIIEVLLWACTRADKGRRNCAQNYAEDHQPNSC